MGIDHDGSPPVTTQTRSGRKRVTPPVEYEEEEDIMDQLAPAATALKKRRLAEQTARRQKRRVDAPSVNKGKPRSRISIATQKDQKGD